MQDCVRSASFSELLDHDLDDDSMDASARKTPRTRSVASSRPQSES